MTDLDLIYGAGNIDDDIVSEALDYKPKRFSFTPILCAAAAAAAVLVVTVSLSEYLHSTRRAPVPPDNALSAATPYSTDSSSPDTSVTVGINSEVIWAIGKSFGELTERYGDVTTFGGSMCIFEKGYGEYVWSNFQNDADPEKKLENIKEHGICTAIYKVSAGDLLTGDISTLNLDNFASSCGFNTLPKTGEAPEENRLIAYYTHPDYEDMTFIMYYNRSGFDEDARFSVDYYSDKTDKADSYPYSGDSDAVLLSIDASGTVGINDEVIWGIGKTFEEVSERYGAITSDNDETCAFQNGYGKYAWDYAAFHYPGAPWNGGHDTVRNGVCRSISGVSASDLLIGDLSTVTLENIASKCGFEVVPLNDDPNTMYEGLKSAYYTHPSYNNVTFCMLYKENGFDKDARFTIKDASAAAEEKTYEERFEGFYPQNPTTYGPPMSLDEVMSMLLPDPLRPEQEVESFYLVEVVRALPLDEAVHMDGWDFNDAEATIYEVKRIKDLISGESFAEDTNSVYVKLPAGESVSIQTRGDPAYAPGEKFTLAMSRQCEGYDFRFSPCDFALRFDLPDNAELTEDDETVTLYYRGIDGPRDAHIFDFAESIDITAVASTPQNPVKYTQKADMEALADFLRRDWRERGISVHYE